jgi:serine/threonine-protein kinase
MIPSQLGPRQSLASGAVMVDSGSVPKRSSSPASGGALDESQQQSLGGGGGSGSGSGVLPQPGRIIADKYRVEQLLAQGGMGAVYAATHVVSGKRVALKWMLPLLGDVPGASERFVREARATARIDHPNVVDVYDVGSDNGSLYLVMEFLHGETLLRRLSRAPVTPRSAVALLMPALRGVAAAHAHGVIHRDLKPDNIFLCESPEGEPREPKVLDFGISKIASGDELRDMALTRSGMVMGTPYYMSPEQVRGASEADARSDVYAFGVMLYEMLTSRRPFEAETYNQLIFKIATEDPVPIASHNPHVDPTLVAIVERAMARSPEARFQSVASLALALEPHGGGATFRLPSSIPGELDAPLARPTLDPKASMRADAVAPGSRWRWLVAAAVVLIVAGVLAWRAQLSPTADATSATPAVGRDTALAKPAPTPAPSAEPAPTLQPAHGEPAAAEAAPQAQRLPQGVSTPAQALGAASKPTPSSAPSASPEPGARKPPRAKGTAASDRKLADDWDERLPIAPGGAHRGPAPSAAGRLSKSDLR